MKEFLKKLIIMQVSLIVGMGLIVLFHFCVIGSQYEYNYQASILDKVARLKALDEPKIILVGSSNLSFGIDSEIIQDKTKMPVVNLGLHGALGNEFHERIAMLDIDKGDIVVVCHTNYSDNDSIGDASLAWVTFDCHRELFPLFRQKDYYELAKSYPTFFRKAFALWISHGGNKDVMDIYSRSAFNKYGDVVYKPDYGNLDDDTLFKNRITYAPSYGDVCINRLNELNSYVNSRGASMVVAAYPIGYGKYSNFTKDDYEVFQEKLDQALDCDVISDYTEYFYPYSYFYNTNYHLTEEGTRVRSEQLAQDISDWIKKEQ